MPLDGLVNSDPANDELNPALLYERLASFSSGRRTIDLILRSAKSISITVLGTLQLAASVFGLAGMYLGSTTLDGAMCYAVAIPCLITCAYTRRLWGLLPLNLAQAGVIGLNFFNAL